MHEMLPRLLALGDDVDAGVLLRLEPDERGIALGLGERFALELPARPELARLGEPAGFGEAAGDRGGEQGHTHTCSTYSYGAWAFTMSTRWSLIFKPSFVRSSRWR